MSAYRQQALIDVPITTVWGLVSDPNRHPEWWPRVCGWWAWREIFKFSRHSSPNERWKQHCDLGD